MISAKKVRELLLILNIKAEPQDTNYLLEYDYRYSSKFKKLMCKTSIKKFTKNKLVNNITITGGSVYVCEYITEEMKLYTR